MRIIGFTINKLLVERKNPVRGKLEINSNLNLENISKEETPLSAKPAMKFDFSFAINYNPGVADIEMKGSVLALDEKDEEKEIMREWKDKKLLEQFRLPLFNFILDKCNVKALYFEEELGLPLHIPFPKLAKQAKQESKQEAKNSEDKNSKEAQKPKTVNYTG